jgi:hypothetical protein
VCAPAAALLRAVATERRRLHKLHRAALARLAGWIAQSPHKHVLLLWMQAAAPHAGRQAGAQQHTDRAAAVAATASQYCLSHVGAP